MKKNILVVLLSLLLSACGGSNTTSAETKVIGNCTPSGAELALLKAHNDARSQARNCGTKAMPAVAKLRYNCKLAAASLGHSRDMAEVGFFSHTGSDGLLPWDRVKNKGYKFRMLSENIAAGQSSVEKVLALWLKSEGHCTNIMAAQPTEMGAAMVLISKGFGTYWTTNFALPQ